MSELPLSDDALVADWESLSAGVADIVRRVGTLIEKSGISAQWHTVLEQLLRAPQHRLTMSQLAVEVSMTAGGFTKLADRMAREGLIDRRGSSGDRRVVHAALTDKGLQAARSASQHYRNALRECLEDIPEAQLKAAAKSLGREREPRRAAPALSVVVAAQRDPALPERRGRGLEDG